MAYAFCIDCKYPGCPWEEIDSFDTRSEALKMLKEYRMAYGADAALKIVRRRGR